MAYKQVSDPDCQRSLPHRYPAMPNELLGNRWDKRGKERGAGFWPICAFGPEAGAGRLL
jgi:hypothetical protein